MTYDRTRAFETLRYRLPLRAEEIINGLTSNSRQLREEAVAKIERRRDGEATRVWPTDESFWRDMQIIAREERKLMLWRHEAV